MGVCQHRLSHPILAMHYGHQGVVTVSGGAMACPQGRGLVIGVEKMKLAKKKEKENILAVF
jgi:hypothetical protein